jgi:hypothetical protein
VRVVVVAIYPDKPPRAFGPYGTAERAGDVLSLVRRKLEDAVVIVSPVDADPEWERVT